VKGAKKERKCQKLTVFILSSDGKYALEKRQNTGLLAGLWQLPNISGHLSVQEAISQAERMGLQPRQILRTVERSHIFTHIQWDMQGIYLEVACPVEEYQWMDPQTIRTQAALPTAFRQFWEEIDLV
jgi:A/G-specific adenine glycosylase